MMTKLVGPAFSKPYLIRLSLKSSRQRLGEKARNTSWPEELYDDTFRASNTGRINVCNLSSQNLGQKVMLFQALRAGSIKVR
jgi:hypothetical protein